MLHSKIIKDKNYLDMINAIENKDIEEMKNAVKSFEGVIFLKEDKEVKQTVMYCKALIMSYEDKEYEKSLALALEALDVASVEELISSINLKRIKRYNAAFYSLNNCIGFNLKKLEKYDLCKELLEATFENIKNNMLIPNISLSNFEKRRIVIVINNYAYSLLITKNYQKALEVCEFGLKQSFKMDKIHVLEFLFKIKTECTYKLGDIEESKKTYRAFLELMKYSNNERVLNELNELIPSEYPLLLDECK